LPINNIFSLIAIVYGQYSKVQYNYKEEGLKLSFNGQQFAELLRLALGDRSINKYGNDSDVDPGYISRLLRCKTKRPPSADIIKKLATKAYNGITAEQFQEAAGYLDFTKSQEEKKPKDLQKFLDQQEIMFDGVPLTEDDKAKVRKALEIVFWDAKAQNKKARAEAKARREKSD